MTIREQVVAWLARQDIPVYLVGGCVRDELLGRPSYDLDVVVAGDGLGLARRLANRLGGACFPLDEERGTARVILGAPGEDGLIVDVAQFRGPDLAADLADRDFTVNALAASARAPDRIIDLHNGLHDLRQGLIRPVSAASIRNDPLRALRAVRLCAELGFVLAPETEALIRRGSPGLHRVAGERIRDELARLVSRPKAVTYLRLLDELQILTVILPELEPLRGLTQPPPHYLDGLAHSFEVVYALEEIVSQLEETRGADHGPEGIPIGRTGVPLGAVASFSTRLCSHLHQAMSDARSRLTTVKLAALMHDTGKPVTREVDERGRIRFIGHERVGAETAERVLRRLRFANAESRLAETIVRHHMRPLLLADQSGVTSRAVYRFFRDTGEAGVDVLLHALADHRATYGPNEGVDTWTRLVILAARMLGDYWTRREQKIDPAPLIDGYGLMREFELEPGPQIGSLLELVREAQVTGEVRTHEEALELVRQRLASGDPR
jgi:putative nucleotidyltransferase with HDIG domain